MILKRITLFVTVVALVVVVGIGVFGYVNGTTTTVDSITDTAPNEAPRLLDGYGTNSVRPPCDFSAGCV